MRIMINSELSTKIPGHKVFLKHHIDVGQNELFSSEAIDLD